MKSSITYLLTLIALLITVVPLVAQDKIGGGEYFIHGVFNPTLADADKYDLRPQLYDTIVPLKPVQYTSLNIRADVPIRVDSISPARLNIIQPLQKMYKAYVKAGFGLYTTPLGELYWDQERSRKNAYGIHLKHLSTNGGIDDVGPSDFSRNQVDVFYKHQLDDHQLGGELYYDRRRVSYYGYDPAGFDSIFAPFTTPTGEEVKRVYNDIGFKADLFSTLEDSSEIAHGVDLDVHFLSTDEDSKETGLVLNGKVGTTQGSETYGLDLKVDMNNYTGSPSGEDVKFEQSGGIVGLGPQVSTEGDRYKVQVGAGIYLDASEKTTFHFFPRAYLHYRLFDDILIPYLGVEGERQRNSLRSLSQVNPWIISAPVLMNTSKKYDVFGGIRGSVSAHLGFDVRISSARFKDMPLYVNEAYYAAGSQFAVLYDRVDVLDVSGELIYDNNDDLQVTGRIDVFTYATDRQSEAWNLPPYRVGIRGRYALRNKLIARLEAGFVGPRQVLASLPITDIEPQAREPQAGELDGYLDLHLGLEYRYTPRFSVFLDASNLSASKYEIWNAYPAQRTLFLGGATYRF